MQHSAMTLNTENLVLVLSMNADEWIHVDPSAGSRTSTICSHRRGTWNGVHLTKTFYISSEVTDTKMHPPQVATVIVSLPTVAANLQCATP